MPRELKDAEIEAMLDGSGDEGSDDEELPEPSPGPSGAQEVVNSENSASDEESEYDSDDNLPLSRLKWKKKKFNSKEMPVEIPPEPNHNQESPAQYFEKYFSKELFEQFALCTSQYYMTTNGGKVMKPACTPGEIKKFFGIHGMMGCFSYPRVKLFWNQRYKFDPIASAMSRDRFFLLRVNLHVLNVHDFNQQEEQAKNRLWRIQPVIDAVRNRCLQLPRESGNYSIDEQMIPFGGRCPGLKVVVKNKPRPEGLKNYVVTTYEGLVLDFEISQGKTTNLPDIEKFGTGPAVILRLSSTLPKGSFLYYDRYFTTIPLMQELLKRKLEGTGTLMFNRFNTKKHTKYEFKKDTSMKRGEHEEIVSGGENICVLKWKDNKGVLMASTAFGSEPVSTVRRWEKKTKEYINVSCPAIVKNYNNFMGGVDICDQMMENYRTWIKTKKWTLKVILHLFDLSIVNSWMEYRRDCKAANMRKKDIMDLMVFRLSVSEYLLTGSPRAAGDRTGPELAEIPISSNYRPKPLPSLDIQLDGYNHWPTFDDLKQPRNCRALNCSSRSRCRCTKCDVYLCLTKDRNCFFTFHQS